ncbi:MAG: hypothetical protein ACPGWR_00670 [Ardenticatenaceae bacterium]
MMSHTPRVPFRISTYKKRRVFPLLKPELWLLIWLFFDFFIYNLSGNFLQLLPKAIQWFSDGIIVLLLSQVLIKRALNLEKVDSKTFIYFPVILFFSIITLSALVNQSDYGSFVLGLRFYLKFPLFYILLINLDLSVSFYNNYKKWFQFGVLLQFPFVAFEYFVLGWKGDFAGGTLGPGGTTHLGLMIALATCIFLAKVSVDQKRILLNLTWIGLLLLTNVLAGVNGNLLLLIVQISFLIFMFFIDSRISILRRLGLIVISLALLWVIISVGKSLFLAVFPGNSIAADILETPQIYWEQIVSATESDLNAGLSFNRLIDARVAFKIVNRDRYLSFFGFGPYYFGESAVLSNDTAGRQLLLTLRLGSIQVSRTVLELGYLGIIASLMLMGAVWLEKRRYARQAITLSQIELDRTVNLMIITFIGMAFYGPVWITPHFAGPFWVWVASLRAEAEAIHIKSPHS